MEVKKHELEDLQSDMDQEIKVLSNSLLEVDERKTRTQKDSKLMQGSAQEEENKTLD